MGDILSWAADQEREKWHNSPEYKAKVALYKRHNKAIELAKRIPLARLYLGDLLLLLKVKEKRDPDNNQHRVFEEEVNQLERIIQEMLC